MSEYETVPNCRLFDEGKLTWKNPDVVEATFFKIEEEQVALTVDCPFCSEYHDVNATID